MTNHKSSGATSFRCERSVIMPPNKSLDARQKQPLFITELCYLEVARSRFLPASIQPFDAFLLKMNRMKSEPKTEVDHLKRILESNGLEIVMNFY